MKFIGQNIYDFISRFRNDIFLEDISTGTIASGGNLGLDSNNKIVKAAEVGSDVDLTSEVTGTLPVANGGTGLTSLSTLLNSNVDHDTLTNFVAAEHFTQANITMVGTIGAGVWQGTPIDSEYLDADTAHLSGTQTFSGAKAFNSTTTFNDNVFFDSANPSQPFIQFTNRNSSGMGSVLYFARDKGAAGADGDNIAELTFRADNSAQELTSFAQILAEVGTAQDTDEAGKLSFKVAASDGSNSLLRDAIVLTGKGEADVVDVSVGYGATSTTTVNGVLKVDGASATFECDTVTFQSDNADDPKIVIQNNTDDNQGARLQMKKNRGASQSNNDNVAEIDFFGEDGNQNQQQYAKILVRTDEVTNGQESGDFRVQVATHNGSNISGLRLVGGSESGEVDVEIGAGAASLTTITGTLTVGSTAFVNNSGVIQVATQGTIDHDSLANFVAAEHYRWDTDISGTATINAANIPTLNQSTTGSAATLTTARNIAGVAFDGSADISLNNNAITNGAGYTTNTGTVDTSGSPVDDDFAKFTGANTIEGRSIAETKTDLSLNNVENKSSATIRGEIVSGDIPNNAADTSGNAATATKLAATKTIAGVAFDGSANISLNNNAITNGAGYTTNTGDITGVSITTDSGGGSKAEDTGGSADFSILGSSGVGVTNSSNTITAVAVPGEIDHDSLLNFEDAEHVDWAGASAGTIHSSNIPTLNQNTTGTAATVTAAAQTNITSLGTLTALDVDDINLNTKTITITGDTSDTFAITTGAAGATTMTTTDAAAAAGHFEVDADGDITLDANGDVNLYPASGDVIIRESDTQVTGASNRPQLTLRSVRDDATAAFLTFDKNRFLGAEEAGTADGDALGTIQWTGTNNVQQLITYANIVSNISEVDDSDEAGKLTLNVASSDGSTSSLSPGLILEGEKATGGEVDVTIANGAASTTTVAGILNVVSGLYMGSPAIEAMDTAGRVTQGAQSGITSLTNLESFGKAGSTVNIVSGDLTMYNAVNNGNPTISLGSSATNRFEIKSLYNSGAQTLDQVQFNSYTTSSTNHDARYVFSVDEVELVKIIDHGLFVHGGSHVQVEGEGATLAANDPTTSSATEGGKLKLFSNDGAAMGDNHRLGVIEFSGSEDASGTITVGAQIEAFCEAAWSASENGGRMVFSTTDGNASTSEVLRLDSDKLATFTGAVTSTGTLTTGDTIELGHASDTTIARSAAGTATIEGNQIMTAGVTKGNIIHVDAPKYVALYLFYVNLNNYWYTPPLYNTQLTTSATIDGATISAQYQARAANYIATRACKVKRVTAVFYLTSSFLSGDIDLEFALVKWSPQNDTNNSTTFTQMTITDKDAAYTEFEIYCCTWDVTDNAASTLAEKDCIAMCVRTTSGASNGSNVRMLTYGHMNYEIELQ